MAHRPEVVAFDVVETLFSLESLRPRLQRAGLAPHMLETWFAQMLRDAFALGGAGIYKPFREVAASALGGLIEAGGRDAKIDEILAGFTELDAESDVAPAMLALAARDVPIVALTNGSADVTKTLIARAGLSDLVARVISVDEIGRWKPQPEVYLHCAAKMGVDPARLALVAAHGWDIQGARRAGLITGYVARDGKPYPAVMEAPDAQADSLDGVIAKLFGR